MITVHGEYNKAVVYTDTADETTLKQIKDICGEEAFRDTKIRIMPDCHAGSGCVIGFTSTITDKVVPNIVGVDIGCFTGETEVQVVGEGNIPFKDLVGRKDKFYVYAVNDEGIIVVSKAKCVKTRENAEIVGVLLDSGEVIECTPDHQFMLRDGEYKRADSLVAGTSLMPLSKIIDNDGYEVVYQPNLKKTERFNRTIAQYEMGMNVEGYHVHHIDGVKLNNFPENLECKTPFTHSREHIFNSGREGFFKTEEFKQKRKEVLDKNGYFDEKFREKKKQVAVENITSYMKNNPTEFEKVVQENADRGSVFFSGCNGEGYMKTLQKFGKIKRVLDLIVDDEKDISFESYEDYRTKTYNGIRTNNVREFLQKYSITLQDVLDRDKWESYILNNHKVVSVEKIEGTYDVYCLQVDKYHNFALKSGVFVHNCGMLIVPLGKIDVDLNKLDEVIRKEVPTGTNRFEKPTWASLDISGLLFTPSNVDNINASLGTLGGGNHFIELAEGKTGDKYFIVHSGSRNLGKQCADYYQKLAIKKLSTPDLTPIIDCMKQIGLHSQISYVLHVLKGSRKKLNPDLAYLTGEDMQAYLHDMKICQAYAMTNRWRIFDNVQKGMGWNYTKSWTTMHNYIDEDNIVRKGAVSAKKGELLLIPLNMRDGSLLCLGKGNEEWNQSAPHGAGRRMSRREALANLSVDDYKDSMIGVYSSTVNENTLDEAPSAYKPKHEILLNIQDTVEVLDELKPLLNFKDDTARESYGTVQKKD